MLQVIVDKMVDYLRNTSDEVTKTEVVKRIGELAERFAPDTQWFLDTMNQVCQAASACWLCNRLAASHVTCAQAFLVQVHRTTVRNKDAGCSMTHMLEVGLVTTSKTVTTCVQSSKRSRKALKVVRLHCDFAATYLLLRTASAGNREWFA